MSLLLRDGAPRANHAIQSYLESCPPEVLLKIFSSTCVDDGFTGRSLSLVSRYIHDASEPVKLQCISVHRLTQMQSFAALLENTPLSLRRVEHLFVSINNAPRDRPSYEIYPRHIWYEDDEESEKAIQEAQAMASAALLRILEPISTCIKSLTVVMAPQLDRPLSFPVLLPCLTELTVIGTSVESFNLLPKLRYLHAAGYKIWHGSLLQKAAVEAPTVTHLRLSGLALQTASWVAEAATKAQGGAEETIVPRFAEELELFLLEVIYAREWTGRCGTHMMTARSRALRSLENTAIVGPNLTFLRSGPKELPIYEVQIAKEVWLDRISGGEGCWKFDPCNVHIPNSATDL